MFGEKLFQTKLLSRLSHKVCRLLSSPVLLRKFTIQQILAARHFSGRLETREYCTHFQERKERLSLRSRLFGDLRDNEVAKEFAILSLKPRRPVRVLIYRAWANLLHLLKVRPKGN